MMAGTMAATCVFSGGINVREHAAPQGAESGTRYLPFSQTLCRPYRCHIRWLQAEESAKQSALGRQRHVHLLRNASPIRSKIGMQSERGADGSTSQVIHVSVRPPARPPDGASAHLEANENVGGRKDSQF